MNVVRGHRAEKGTRQMTKAKKIIEATGAKLRYLPPYSPDLNPIELCWAQLKQHLRALKARSVITLEVAIDTAMKSLIPSHTLGYFRHCGYTP